MAPELERVRQLAENRLAAEAKRALAESALRIAIRDAARAGSLPAEIALVGDLQLEYVLGVLTDDD